MRGHTLSLPAGERGAWRPARWDEASGGMRRTRLLAFLSDKQHVGGFALLSLI